MTTPLSTPSTAAMTAQADADQPGYARLRVRGTDLHRWIQAVTPYAEDDPMIPALSCVQLLVHPQPDGTAVVYLAATNRYDLAVAKIPVLGEIEACQNHPRRSWDLTIPARDLTAAVAGIARRGAWDTELVIEQDRLLIHPDTGYDRCLRSTGARFPRWDTLLHAHNPAWAASVDTIAISARHLGLLGRTLLHSGGDMARVRSVQTPAGSSMAAVTISSVAERDPWLVLICMGSYTPGLTLWGDLDQLTAELDHTTSVEQQPADPNTEKGVAA